MTPPVKCDRGRALSDNNVPKGGGWVWGCTHLLQRPCISRKTPNIKTVDKRVNRRHKSCQGDKRKGRPGDKIIADPSFLGF